MDRSLTSVIRSAEIEMEVRVVARKHPSHDAGSRPVREAKTAALEKVRAYAAAAVRENNIMALRKCSLNSVRATRGGEEGELRWYCTPHEAVRNEHDLDEELLDEEAEEEEAAQRDDQREAEQFADYDDDGDSDYESSRSGAALKSMEDLTMGEEYEVNREGFVYLCGTAMTKWLESRVHDAEGGSVSLSTEDASQWGLTEARDIEWEGTERTEILNGKEVDMMIPADRILFWDGKNPDVPLPDGMNREQLEPNCFYASSFDDLRKGRTPEWWQVLLYTLEREETSQSSLRHSSPNHSPNGKPGPHARLIEDPKGTHVVLTSNKMHVVLDRIFARCKGHPNRVERTDGAWSRPDSIIIQSHFDTAQITFAQSKERECAKSSVLNAARALCPDAEKFLRKISLETRPAYARCLKDLGKWTQEEVRVLSVQHATPKKGKNSEEVDAAWVLENTSDVLLVNLIGEGSVNHIVCVDAREGHRKIYDSYERHPIHLSEEALQCCVGDGHALQHIFVRKVVIKPNCEGIIHGKRGLKRANGRKRKRRAIQK